MNNKRVLLFSVIALLALSFIFLPKEKYVQGTVIDCDTDNPIRDAEISVNQRGWGTNNGQLVWDKDFVYLAKTDENGRFYIKYKVGSSVNLRAKKQGYLAAEQWEEKNSDVVMKMQQGDIPYPLEVTYNCKTLSECMKCEMVNNVNTCRNVCI
jgi:hypothetical protein